jgi:hypothetical protein
VRILFRSLGQADSYLKTSKKALANNLIAADGGRLPIQRVRDALCKGLGYYSYDELKLDMSPQDEHNNPFESPDDLHKAFTKGFSLALDVAEEYGFRLSESVDTLADRLAEEALRNWSS